MIKFIKIKKKERNKKMSFKKRIIASTSLALLLGFSTETFVDAQEIHNNENNQSQVQQTNQSNQ